MLQFTNRAGRLMDLSPAFDLEYFGRTALLTCEREFLEFTDEQDWFDGDNDHFCSAFRTCWRILCCGWRFLTGHVTSFRRSEGNGQTWRVPSVRGMKDRGVAAVPRLSMVQSCS